MTRCCAASRRSPAARRSAGHRRHHGRFRRGPHRQGAVSHGRGAGDLHAALRQDYFLKIYHLHGPVQGLQQPLRPHRQPVRKRPPLYLRQPLRARPRHGEIKKRGSQPLDYKYHRMFDYEPLPLDKADRGVVAFPGCSTCTRTSPSGRSSLRSCASASSSPPSPPADLRAGH